MNKIIPVFLLLTFSCSDRDRDRDRDRDSVIDFFQYDHSNFQYNHVYRKMLIRNDRPSGYFLAGNFFVPKISLDTVILELELIAPDYLINSNMFRLYINGEEYKFTDKRKLTFSKYIKGSEFYNVLQYKIPTNDFFESYDIKVGPSNKRDVLIRQLEFTKIKENLKKYSELSDDMDKSDSAIPIPILF